MAEVQGEQLNLITIEQEEVETQLIPDISVVTENLLILLKLVELFTVETDSSILQKSEMTETLILEMGETPPDI